MLCGAIPLIVIPIQVINVDPISFSHYSDMKLSPHVSCECKRSMVIDFLALQMHLSAFVAPSKHQPSKTKLFNNCHYPVFTTGLGGATLSMVMWWLLNISLSSSCMLSDITAMQGLLLLLLPPPPLLLLLLLLLTSWETDCFSQLVKKFPTLASWRASYKTN